jgi:hypothetical protein
MIIIPPTNINARGKMTEVGMEGNRKILGSRNIPPRITSIHPLDRFPEIRISPTRTRIIGHEKITLPIPWKTIQTGLKNSPR